MGALIIWVGQQKKWSAVALRVVVSLLVQLNGTRIWSRILSHDCMLQRSCRHLLTLCAALTSLMCRKGSCDSSRWKYALPMSEAWSCATTSDL